MRFSKADANQVVSFMSRKPCVSDRPCPAVCGKKLLGNDPRLLLLCPGLFRHEQHVYSSVNGVLELPLTQVETLKIVEGTVVQDSFA